MGRPPGAPIFIATDISIISAVPAQARSDRIFSGNDGGSSPMSQGYLQNREERV